MSMNTLKRIAQILLLACCCLTLLVMVARSGNKPAPTVDDAAKVTVSNVKFEPRTLTVKAGTTVTWENKEGSHTVTSDTGAFASDTLSAGQTFSHKFDKPGRYPYYCTFHGSKGGHDMAGVIVVTK
jgi:plastocyanin